MIYRINKKKVPIKHDIFIIRLEPKMKTEAIFFLQNWIIGRGQSPLKTMVKRTLVLCKFKALFVKLWWLLIDALTVKKSEHNYCSSAIKHF